MGSPITGVGEKGGVSPKRRQGSPPKKLTHTPPPISLLVRDGFLDAAARSASNFGERGELCRESRYSLAAPGASGPASLAGGAWPPGEYHRESCQVGGSSPAGAYRGAAPPYGASYGEPGSTAAFPVGKKRGSVPIKPPLKPKCTTQKPSLNSPGRFPERRLLPPLQFQLRFSLLPVCLDFWVFFFLVSGRVRQMFLSFWQ